jgi:hypothetical protein
MKRFLLIVSAIAIGSAWAQPKVAVLDTMIPQNMDPSVIVPTTEKIIERLVVSGRFTVLDRANIENVLKEREFQVSGMVSDKDVVAAGKYLGADFVVVTKVQKVDVTYFISAKMIAVKTGVIANQTSAQGEGRLATLINLSEQVGEVLSGGAVLAQSAAGGNQDISKPDAKAAPASQDRPSKETPVGRAKMSWPWILNVVPGFGVGSFVQGDKAGGWLGIIGCVLGEGLYYAGIIENSTYTYDSTTGEATYGDGSSQMLLGAAVLTGTMIYGIVRPITYAHGYNREHGFTSINLAPTIATTSVGGKTTMEPGALLTLSF